MIQIVCLNPAMDRTVLIGALQPGHVHRSERGLSMPGGKGINVARFLKEIDPAIDVRLVGFAGGYIGDYIRCECKQAGLFEEFTQIEQGSRVCTTLVESDRATVINEPGPTLSEDDIQRFWESLNPNADLVVISGSIPDGAPDSLYAEIIRYYNRLSVPVYLDSSGPALKKGIAAGPLLIKPNEEEFRFLVGIDDAPVSTADIVELSQSLLQTGISYVLVSLGSRGLILVSKHAQAALIPALSVAVRNPIGCGDALVAGISYGMVQTGDIRIAVQYGVAAAALNAMNLIPSLGNSAALYNYMRQVSSVPMQEAFMPE
ncbi:MAG: 1-phosphofructokinase family hexose kinase [Bacilli bacterium]